MARTKASVGAKLTSGKSSKAVKTSSSTPSRSGPSTPSTSKGSSGSGNPYHPRPTPKWQKPITSFFGDPSKPPQSGDEDIGGGSSNARARHSRQITSDTESDVEGAGDDLNASSASNIDLPPLSPDENSHKILEYFKLTTKQPERSNSIKGKGKGKGKKSIQNDENSEDSNETVSSKNGESENKENSTTNNVILSNGDSEKEKSHVKAEKRESDVIEPTSSKRVKIS